MLPTRSMTGSGEPRFLWTNSSPIKPHFSTIFESFGTQCYIGSLEEKANHHHLSVPRNLRTPSVSIPMWTPLLYKVKVQEDGRGVVTPDIPCSVSVLGWFLLLFAFTNIQREIHWISLDISKAAPIILSGSVSQHLTFSRKYWVHLERHDMHWFARGLIP